MNKCQEETELDLWVLVQRQVEQQVIVRGIQSVDTRIPFHAGVLSAAHAGAAVTSTMHPV